MGTIIRRVTIKQNIKKYAEFLHNGLRFMCCYVTLYVTNVYDSESNRKYVERKGIYMNKRILALILTLVFGSSAGAVHAVETGEVTDNNNNKVTLICETDTITQSDYDDDFQHYALPEATVDMEFSVNTRFGGDPTNVVGVVRDYDTEELIQNASISVNGERVVVTGEDGRFQIKNMPSGVYNWEISAAGYCPANYVNYDVDSADGTTIFTFYVNCNSEVFRDREEILHNDDEVQTIPPNLVNRGNFATSMSTRAMSSLPSVSSTVSVYYNNATRSVGRQTYIYTVTSAELYGAGYYRDLGMTSSQIEELFRAQAVAANTFLEYALSVYSNHGNTDYKVCSTACCQVYDPTKVTQVAIDATARIFYSSGGVVKTDIMMYKPSSTTYEYIWGAFFSSCGNNGTLSHSSQPALRAVSCTDITQGAGGHRYGLCQMGAAYRAKNGNSASTILLHYYSGCRMMSCRISY